MKLIKDSTPRPAQSLFASGFHRLCIYGVVLALVLPALPGLAQPADVGGKKELTCYTANAYDGADLNPAIILDPTDPNYLTKLLVTVTGIYGQIVASDPPTRMAGLAREIAARHPDVAGLEEVWTLQTAPATPRGPGAFTPVFDWLQLLTNALAAEGVSYHVAVVSTEADIVMPLLTPSGGVQYGRLTDHEVILVRGDLPPGYLRVSNPQTGRFSTYSQIPSINLSIYRGWCAVDLLTRGERLRFICAHLEEEILPAVQQAQALELLAGPAATDQPVILVGDFNADPLHRDGVATYDTFPEAGFGDAWLAMNPSDPAGGVTWGHDPLLADPTTLLSWRLDFVFYRGSEFLPLTVDVLDPALGRRQAPLWPSDHAAVFARFALKNANPN